MQEVKEPPAEHSEGPCEVWNTPAPTLYPEAGFILFLCTESFKVGKCMD